MGLCLIQNKDLEHYGAAKVMTNFLRSSLQYDVKKELWSDICGTGLRSGAAMTMFANGLNIAEVSLRGGWYFTDITKAYEYLIAEEYTVSRGGKVLGGWDKDFKCFTPKCGFTNTMSEKKKRDFNSFLNSFRYASNMPSMLVEVMCASVLKNLETFTREYGSNHIINKQLFSKAERCGISISELTEYGKMISEECNDLNVLNSVKPLETDINEVLAVSLQKVNAMNNQEMKNMRAEIKILRAENNAFQQSIKQLINTAQSILEECKQLKSRVRSSPIKAVQEIEVPIPVVDRTQDSETLTIVDEIKETITLHKSSLRAAIYELNDIATPVSVVFYNWYYYRCNSNEKNFVYKGEQKDKKREIRRIKAVMGFCYANVSDKDRNTIDYVPLDTSSSLFEIWAGNLHNISANIEQSVMELLLKLERDKTCDDLNPAKRPRQVLSPNVSAIYQRLEMLGLSKKYAEEPKLGTITLNDTWKKA